MGSGVYGVFISLLALLCVVALRYVREPPDERVCFLFIFNEIGCLKSVLHGGFNSPGGGLEWPRFGRILRPALDLTRCALLMSSISS